MKKDLKKWLVDESVKFLKITLCVLSSAFYSLCSTASAFADIHDWAYFRLSDGYEDSRVVFDEGGGVWFPGDEKLSEYKDTSDKTLAQIRRNVGKPVWVVKIYDDIRNFSTPTLQVLDNGFLELYYDNTDIFVAELPYSVVTKDGAVILRYSVTVPNYEWLRGSYRITIAVIVDEAYYRENMNVIGGLR